MSNVVNGLIMMALSLGVSFVASLILSGDKPQPATNEKKAKNVELSSVSAIQ